MRRNLLCLKSKIVSFICFSWNISSHINTRPFESKRVLTVSFSCIIPKHVCFQVAVKEFRKPLYCLCQPITNKESSRVIYSPIFLALYIYLLSIAVLSFFTLSLSIFSLYALIFFFLLSFYSSSFFPSFYLTFFPT